MARKRKSVRSLQSEVERKSWNNKDDIKDILRRLKQVQQYAEQPSVVKQFEGTPEFWKAASMATQDNSAGVESKGKEYDESIVESQEEKEEEEEEEYDSDDWDDYDEQSSEEHSSYYTIIGPVKGVFAVKFGIDTTEYRIKWREIQKSSNYIQTVKTALREILEKVYGDGDAGDMVGCKIDHPALFNSINIPWSTQAKLTVHSLYTEIEKRQQSKKALTFGPDMRMTFARVREPKGGRLMQTNADANVWLKNKKSIIKINNTDRKCLQRAVAVAIAHKRRGDSDEAKLNSENMVRGRKVQEEAADEIMFNAGLASHNGPCGRREWILVEQSLDKRYKLQIFAQDCCRGVVYRGREAKETLNLYLYDSHFAVITSMEVFANRSYYCDRCTIGFDHKNTHVCLDICDYCKQLGKCISDDKRIKCMDCNKWLPSRKCYDQHKSCYYLSNGDEGKRTKMDSMCNTSKRCNKCKRIINNGEKHECYTWTCSACKMLVKNTRGHQFHCYMQPAEREKDESGEFKKFEKSFIFFDFEANQDREIERDKDGQPIFAHDPNYCIVHKVCDICKNDKEIWDYGWEKKAKKKQCKRCKLSHKKFEGPDCRDEFAKWLYSSENNECIAMAHNAKGYDAQFLLQYLAQQGVPLSEKNLIMNGTTIIQLQACGVTVKDTKCFIPMSLAKMAKSFALKESVKGYFPYTFDTKENRFYKGPWPEAKYYLPDEKKPEDRIKFFEWYELQKDKVFDMMEEKHTYCDSDVKILREGGMQFRDDFMGTNGGIDPFHEACTIASACNKEFRTHHLKPNTIGLIPAGGYRRRERHSISAMKWLMWLSVKDGLDIQHALNGLECRVDRYKVDGKCGNTVYEFNGCIYHGCQKCFPDGEIRSFASFKNMSEKYQDTLEKEEELKLLGYTVVTMWECDMNWMLTVDGKMKNFFDNCNIVGPLDPRDAFFGGRTGPITLYKKVEEEEGERIDYVDVCSLYPWVNKYCEYPVGHPKIITENFEEMSADQKDKDRYFGLVKGTFLPPRNLIHPVLPWKSPTGKLCFTLCRMCCAKNNQDACNHTDKERALSGTYVTPELYEAFEAGYKVLELNEVWHYKEKSSDLFSSYVDKYLLGKVTNSGWNGLETETEKQKFIDDYYEHENIRLNPNEIEDNPGKREQDKLMLNSFWGKFGQRTNLMKTKMLNDPSQLWEILFDKRYETHAINVMTEEMLMIRYQTAALEFEEVMTNTNVVIAAFTTGHARLKLYSYMKILDDRVLYTDTDSIIYKTRPSSDVYMVPLGPYLGDMTDEITSKYGKNARIIVFACTGPKSYGIMIDKGDGTLPICEVKSKGFYLDYATGQLISMNKMIDMAKNKCASVVTTGRGIRRTKDHQLVTRTVTKTIRNTANKRKCIPNTYITCPFGYLIKNN